MSSRKLPGQFPCSISQLELRHAVYHDGLAVLLQLGRQVLPGLERRRELVRAQILELADPQLNLEAFAAGRVEEAILPGPLLLERAGLAEDLHADAFA